MFDGNIIGKESVVSIIIPTYNRAKLVSRALDSVLDQSCPNWECWVIDDFSNDDTKTVVSVYCSKDHRIHYSLNQHAKGAQGARNSGIEKCAGDWVLLLDSDNTITPDYVKKVLAFVQDNPSVDVVVNFIRILDSDKHDKGSYCWVTEGNILKGLLREKTYVDNSSACIRKEKLFEIGLLDEQCPSYQEWDTHIRLSQCCKYGTIREFLTNYYDHNGKRISQHTKSIYGNGLYVLKKHRILWITTVGEDEYARLLLHVYDLRKESPFMDRMKVLFVVSNLSPKLFKQLLKRRFLHR